MSYQARVLPPEEWSRLDGTRVAPLAAAVSPSALTVVVVEDHAGQVVGTWTLLNVMHVEGFWVRDDHRGQGAVLRRLIAATRAEAIHRGLQLVWTSTTDEVVGDMLKRVGASLIDAQHFLLPVAAPEGTGA